MLNMHIVCYLLGNRVEVKSYFGVVAEDMNRNNIGIIIGLEPLLNFTKCAFTLHLLKALFPGFNSSNPHQVSHFVFLFFVFPDFPDVLVLLFTFTAAQSFHCVVSGING